MRIAMKRPAPKRILVSLPTINRPERLKLDGLLDYAHRRRAPTWRVELDFDALAGRSTRLAEKAFDGIVAYVESAARRQELLSAGVPLVLIEDVLTPPCLPDVSHAVTLLCDHEAEGRAAADYFLARHFRHFAWLGPVRATEWADARRDGFVARLRACGLDCTGLGADPRGLAAELKALPRPCALFCVHDFRAREALDAAADAGLAVPDALAILGMDDDAAICTTASPALSSLSTGDFRLGIAAGRILNELLQRPGLGGRVIRFACRHVTSRRSTDADALADAYVASTLRHARGHLDGQLDAATLARRVGYSKHGLQIRAERALGHTLGEEIRRMRIAAAHELVTDTDMPIAEIAAACGFTSVSHLAMRFKETCGQTPLAFRRALLRQPESPQGEDPRSRPDPSHSRG